MEFSLTKDYLGLSDVIFVNEECQESEVWEGQCINSITTSTTNVISSIADVKPVIFAKVTTGEFQRNALSPPKPSAEVPNMQHVERERAKRSGFQNENLLAFSHRERNEITNDFQQRRRSVLEREQKLRKTSVPLLQLERGSSPKEFSHRPLPDVFQQRTLKTDQLVQRYIGSRMSGTGAPSFPKSSACGVSQAKRTAHTSTEQQIGQVNLGETSEMSPKFYTYQIEQNIELQSRKQYNEGSGLRQSQQTERGPGTERPKCGKNQNDMFMSQGNEDNTARFRPFPVQMSDTPQYISPHVSVTGSQWRNMEIVPSYANRVPSIDSIVQSTSKSVQSYAKNHKLECKFCKTNGERNEFYRSHDLKDAKGLVTCPVLRTFQCPICKATGDYAHTITYCPFGSGQCSVMVTRRTPRMSCGRPRLLDRR